MLAFPDIEAILCDVLSDLGTTGVLQGPEIYDDDVSDLPVILVSSLDGDQRGMLNRTSYVTIVVGAEGRNESRQILEQIVSRLCSGPTVSSLGLLDSCDCTMPPRRLAQPMDALEFQQANFAVETRGF